MKANAFLVPYLLLFSGITLGIAVASICATLAIHLYWGTKPERGFILPRKGLPGFYKLSVAGWLHVIFQSAQTTILFLYVICSVPPRVAFIASLVLVLHVLVGSLQPEWYVKKKLTFGNIATTSVLILLIVGVASAK